MKSSLILMSTVIALGLAALVVWSWGTRPEPTVMLFVGTVFAILGAAARRPSRLPEPTATRLLGVTKS